MGLINASIEWLERRGQVDTFRRDDIARYLDESIFELSDDNVISTTPYALKHMVPSVFPANKGDGWRMFVLGASFAQGSPYLTFASDKPHARHDASGHLEDGVLRAEEPGGLPFWLRTWLKQSAPEREVEVINAAVGGQQIHRVRHMLDQVVRLEPDVLFVASCNNEGGLPPSRVNEALHSLGGYRLLLKYIKPSMTPDKLRPAFTLQDPDLEVVRQRYRENVADMVKTTEATGVPLLLATLPINLMYVGREVESLQLGLKGQPQTDSRQRSPCISAGIERYKQGDFDEAIEEWQQCEDLADAVRLIGMAHHKQGNTNEAIEYLEMSLELAPYNRCRPSFNEHIRDIAGRYDHVHLVDLDKAAREAAPEGIPGFDMFLDSCHMRSRGYALMANAIIEALSEAGLGPFSEDRPDLVAVEDMLIQYGIDPKESGSRGAEPGRDL